MDGWMDSNSTSASHWAVQRPGACWRLQAGEANKTTLSVVPGPDSVLPKESNTHFPTCVEKVNTGISVVRVVTRAAEVTPPPKVMGFLQIQKLMRTVWLHSDYPSHDECKELVHCSGAMVKSASLLLIERSSLFCNVCPNDHLKDTSSTVHSCCSCNNLDIHVRVDHQGQLASVFQRF